MHTAAPVGPRPRVTATHTSLGAPTLRLNSRLHEEKDTPATTHPDLPEEPFTDEAFQAAWQAFIDSHATEHLLINTMRASHPVRVRDAHFRMDVEGPVQVEIMANAMQELLDFLRGALRNHALIVTAKATLGPTSPLTWTEREVLADIARRHPTLNTFISDLSLPLL